MSMTPKYKLSARLQRLIWKLRKLPHGPDQVTAADPVLPVKISQAARFAV